MIEDSVIKPAHRGLGILTLFAVAGALGACGPVAPTEPEAAQSPLPSLRQAVSSTGPQVSAEFALNPALPTATEHDAIAIAAGNGIYLAVWSEYVSNVSAPDIMATRIRASDGVALDATPIRVGTGPSPQLKPAVAFDGNNFLIVWEDTQSTPLIYGARVRASDGAVLDATPFLVSQTNMGPYRLPQQMPSVAFDGTNYLVAWSSHFFENNTVSNGIQGIRIRPSDGARLETYSFLIGRNATEPRVAYAGNYYLVAWATRTQNIEAARVTTAGTLVDTTPLSIAATSAAETSPAVASRGGQFAGGGEFLVVWTGANSSLWGRRVRVSDGAKLDAADLLLGPAVAAPASVTFDGQDYRVAWEGTRNGVRKALSTRVSAVGVVAQEAELAVSDLHASSRPLRGGIAASGLGRFATVYMQYEPTASPHRGRLRLVEDVRVSVSAELPVSSSTLRQREPAIAKGNGVYLAVWAEELSASRADIYAVRARVSDGSLLDAAPIRIAEGPAHRLNPAVSFAGEHFLVVWSQSQVGEPRADGIILGARVKSADGAVVDAPFRISADAATGELTPAVASDGTNFLVTWATMSSPSLRAMRIRASDGQRVDAANVAFGGAHLAEKPRVAYGGARYLVAWQVSNMGYNVYGARLDATSGALVDATPLDLATSVADEKDVAVASDGTHFLVTFRSGFDRVRAIRVLSSSGPYLGGPNFIAVDSSATPSDATFDGADFRIAWEGPVSVPHKLFTTRVTTQGQAGEGLGLTNVHPASPARPVAIAAAAPGHHAVAFSQFDPTLGVDRVKLQLVAEGPPLEACDTLAPVIVLSGAATTTLECGPGTYSDAGARAFDGCGNALTVQAYNTGNDESGPGPQLSSEGSYSVSYIAVDSQGRSVSAVRTVNVEDQTAPTVTLKGAAFMTHTCGSQWEDPGIEATDACYGNVSDWGWRSGEVNGWAEGTYTVSYYVTDGGGNASAPVTRTVEVVDCPW
jgi:hypothetical protein